MKKVKIPFIFIPILTITSAGLFAQQSTNASGGEANGSSGSVSYSVGQVVYNTHDGSNGYSVQGVQQPYEISVVTNVESNLSVSLECKAYPNPSTDYLILEMQNSEDDYEYRLSDIKGRLICSDNIESATTKIEMAGLAPATYLLIISKNKSDVKTFKIIKNQIFK